jgi:hypothetical protein
VRARSCSRRARPCASISSVSDLPTGGAIPPESSPSGEQGRSCPRTLPGVLWGHGSRRAKSAAALHPRPCSTSLVRDLCRSGEQRVALRVWVAPVTRADRASAAISSRSGAVTAAAIARVRARNSSRSTAYWRRAAWSSSARRSRGSVAVWSVTAGVRASGTQARHKSCSSATRRSGASGPLGTPSSRRSRKALDRLAGLAVRCVNGGRGAGLEPSVGSLL